jgi:hypothetical protein
VKRSEINESIQLAQDVFEAHRFALPKWAYWSPANWEHCGPEVLEIKSCMLGWHVTDFGLNRFPQQGVVQFTLRNCPIDRRKSRPAPPPFQVKPYSEKIMLLQKLQTFPFHFLQTRTKDLINRGGGDLLVQIHRLKAQQELDEESRAPVSINGISYNLKAGGVVRLAPGDSITTPPRFCHKFWAEKASCLVGEVSTSHSDPVGHAFVEEAAWFIAVEEDEAPLFLMCNEYPELMD